MAYIILIIDSAENDTQRRNDDKFYLYLMHCWWVGGEGGDMLGIGSVTGLTLHTNFLDFGA